MFKKFLSLCLLIGAFAMFNELPSVSALPSDAESKEAASTHHDQPDDDGDFDSDEPASNVVERSVESESVDSSAAAEEPDEDSTEKEPAK